jgi:small subunit ribosomal protein S17
MTATAKPADTKKTTTARVGVVESDKRSKTRKVVVPNPMIHPKYGKIIRRRTVLHVHDEANESRLGDMVEVVPCRPISKTKRWKLVRIVAKGAGLRFQGVETPGQEKKD